MKTIIFFSLAALLLWMVMFSPWTAPHINFWVVMTISSSILAGGALFIQRKNLRDVFAFKASYPVIGILSAIVLYLVFFIGNIAAGKLFAFADGQVSGIYALKTQSGPVVVGLLLFFIIGPAEEIFWRGFLQKRLAAQYGALSGYMAAAAIYTLVHFWAFNFMLAGAALFCSLSWGFIFLKFRSVWPGIISHAVWDLAIFILLPVK